MQIYNLERRGGAEIHQRRKGKKRLKRRKEHRRSGSSYELGQGYKSANFRKVSRGKIPPPFA